MIELKNLEQFDKAIERAKAERKDLLVQLTERARQYRVINRRSNQIYVVTFHVSGNGRRFGNCTCQAGTNGLICKHIAAAAGLNMCLAAQGRLNQKYVQPM